MKFDNLAIDDLRQRRGKKWSAYGPDVLPAWVADMDFPVAPAIHRRLMQVLSTSDLGYPADGQAARLAELLSRRCSERFQWSVDPGRVEVIVDVMQGLQMCLEMFTQPGQGAAILTPIYPPFLDATRAMSRRADCCTLFPGEDGFEIDLQLLEASIGPDTRILLLCNPHNPTGRVFSRPELVLLAELALKHDLMVVSDEVHSDLVFTGNDHVPFASLGPEIEERTVTLMSASKAFNTAGLRCAMMIFGSDGSHSRYRNSVRFTRGALSSLGMHATEAAWTECDDWLASLLRHLESNRNLMRGFLADQLPEVRFLPPQATYLAWLNCRDLGLGKDLWQTVLDKGKLALSDGRDFGPGGEDCIRLNFATTTHILCEALDRLRRSLVSQT